MRKHLLVVTAACFLTAHFAFARLVQIPTYKEMTDKADLIVIATPTGSVELEGRATFPGIGYSDAQGKMHDLAAIQIETTFRPIALLKGKLPENAAAFKLLHFKLVNPEEGARNGPNVVAFDPAQRAQYLMFLKLRPDGSYEAYSGQTDPAYSVEKLGQTAMPSQ